MGYRSVKVDFASFNFINECTLTRVSQIYNQNNIQKMQLQSAHSAQTSKVVTMRQGLNKQFLSGLMFQSEYIVKPQVEYDHVDIHKAGDCFVLLLTKLPKYWEIQSKEYVVLVDPLQKTQKVLSIKSGGSYCCMLNSRELIYLTSQPVLVIHLYSLQEERDVQQFVVGRHGELGHYTSQFLTFSRTNYLCLIGCNHKNYLTHEVKYFHIKKEKEGRILELVESVIIPIDKTSHSHSPVVQLNQHSKIAWSQVRTFNLIEFFTLQITALGTSRQKVYSFQVQSLRKHTMNQYTKILDFQQIRENQFVLLVSFQEVARPHSEFKRKYILAKQNQEKIYDLQEMLTTPIGKGLEEKIENMVVLKDYTMVFMRTLHKKQVVHRCLKIIDNNNCCILEAPQHSFYTRILTSGRPFVEEESVAIWRKPTYKLAPLALQIISMVDIRTFYLHLLLLQDQDLDQDLLYDAVCLLDTRE